jgi:hypothetical protein
MGHHVVTDYTTNISTENSNVKVFVRARPCADGSQPPQEFYRPDGSDRRKITVKDPNVPGAAATAFAFDEVFWTGTSQSEIYQACCEPMIKHCLKGFNSCLFAYGQTGSGKTYNIFGEDSNRGIIPRAVTDLFASLENIAATKNVALAVSFLEIYNDQIRDIGQAYLDKMEKTNGGVSPKKEQREMMTSDWFKKKQLMKAMDIDKDHRGVVDEASPALTINEDQEKNIFVRDLAVIPVTSESEVIAIVQSGLRLRATHETQMNAVSSRSHTVFTITIVQKDHATGEEMTGMLNLVDLAGSERLKKSESEGVRLQEALHINSSLSALGKVIVALDPNAGSTHIPYRDSKLTRLLQNSIGGNSYTTLLATIHPSESHTSESVSTLQFANRCRAVTNQPRVNYSSKNEVDKDRQIKRLLEEIIQLRDIIQQMSAEKISFAIGLLRSMGMDAQPGPDGSIMVMNEKGELQELKFTVGADGKSEFHFSKGRIAHSKENSSKGDGEDTYRMRVELDRVTRERDNSKKKLKTQKEAYKNLQAALMESNRRCAQIASDQKQVVDRLQQSIEQSKYEQQLSGDQQRDQFREEMHKLVAHNTKLMNHNTMQASSSRKLMKGVGGYSQFDDDGGWEAKGASSGGGSKGVSSAEVGRRLKQQQDGHEAELAALHQKYQHWLQKHCETEEAFVTRFNDYAKQKQQQMSVWRNESTLLYDAAQALEQHLQLYEQEEYLTNPANGISGVLAVGGGAAAARSSRSTYHGGNSDAMLMPAGAGGRVPVAGNRGHSASRGRLHHKLNGGDSIGPDGVGTTVVAVSRARELLTDTALLQLTKKASEFRRQQEGVDAAWEAGAEGVAGGRRSGGRDQEPQSTSYGSKGKDRIVPIGVQRAQRHSERPTSAPAKPKHSRTAIGLTSGGPGGGGGARPHSAMPARQKSAQSSVGAWTNSRSPSKSRSKSANARVQIQSRRVDMDSDEEDEQQRQQQQQQQQQEDGLEGELEGEEAVLRRSIERRAQEDERQLEEAVQQVMHSSLVGMCDSDLKEHVQTLRKYISSGLEERLQAKVLSRVQEHPTVQLVHSLENDKDHYKRKFSDESRKHRELRVAYRALVREEEKLRLNQYSSSHNPAGKSGHASSKALLRRKKQQQQQGRGQVY